MKTRFARPVAACSVALILVWVGSSSAQDTAKQRPAPAREEERAASKPASLPAPAGEKAESSPSPKEKLARLQRENAALRARVKELEGQVDQLKRQRIVTAVPRPGDGRAVPPDWKPKPFGGGVYYVVPLDKTAGDGPKATVETPARPQAEAK